MVIQRWQSLFLLIAVILMCVFCATPFAQIKAAEAAAAPVYAQDFPVFLILNIVIAALLTIAIFLYKNLRLQMRITLITILLIATSVVCSAFIIYRNLPEADLILIGGVVLLLAALVFAVMALRFMKKDHRLLRSYDRLR